MRTPEPSRSGSRDRRSIPHRKAAKVLPDPVGAQIRVCSREAIAGQPCSWAGVGASKELSNQRLTGGEKRSRGDLGVAGGLMANLMTIPGTTGGWRALRLREMLAEGAGCGASACSCPAPAEDALAGCQLG